MRFKGNLRASVPSHPKPAIGMAEGLFRDYSPDLTELENKIGMKTPESLLTWMRDAPNCEGGRRSEVSGRENHSADFPEALSDKINNLKKELVNISVLTNNYFLCVCACVLYDTGIFIEKIPNGVSIMRFSDSPLPVYFSLLGQS